MRATAVTMSASLSRGCRFPRAVTMARPRREHAPPRPAATALGWAVSTRQCIFAGQVLVKHLGWGAPVEGFSRAAVEFGGDCVEVGLAVDGEVGALGEVLAE